HADRKQYVYLTIKSNQRAARDLNYALLVDRTHAVRKIRAEDIPNWNITEMLSFDQPPDPEIHHIVVQPDSRLSKNEGEIIVRVDTRKAQLVVLDVYGIMNSVASPKQQGGSPYTIKALLAAFPSNTAPKAVLNAGFSSNYNVPFPTGLLIYEGQTVSKADESS